MGFRKIKKPVKGALGHLKRIFVNGSMTVETAVVLPLFLIFFINLSGAVEMIRLHSNLELALWNTGNDMSFYGALFTEPVKSMGKTGHKTERPSKDDPGNENNPGGIAEETGYGSGVEKTGLPDRGTGAEETELGKKIVQELGDFAVSYIYIKNRITRYLGEEYLNNSPIRDGADGLSFLETEIIDDKDIVDIGVTYRVSPPINFGELLTFRMFNRYYAHLWNGYDINGNDKEEKKCTVVYVTKDSKVYHTSTRCTYLNLAIRPSPYSMLEEERNSSGGRYGRCLICAWGEHPDTVYLCDEGGKYHYSRDCYSLKRNYSAVSLESIAGTHKPCSRCGQ